MCEISERLEPMTAGASYQDGPLITQAEPDLLGSAGERLGFLRTLGEPPERRSRAGSVQNSQMAMFRAAYIPTCVVILAYVSVSFTYSWLLSVPSCHFVRSRHVTCAPEARRAYGETRGARRRSPANPVLLEQQYTHNTWTKHVQVFSDDTVEMPRKLHHHSSTTCPPVPRP